MSQEAPVTVDGVNCAEVGASQEDGLPERTVVGESLTDDHEPGEEENSSKSADDESVCSDLSSSSSTGESQDGNDDDDMEEVPAPAKKTKPNAGGSAAARSSDVSAASAPAEAQGAVSPRPQAKGAARPADGGARRVVEEASPEPTKRKPSSVWEDFDVCANDSDYAVCKHCKVKIKRCGGTSSLTKHRNGQHSAGLVARNQLEPRHSTLDGSVTTGPRFLTNAVKWILLKYQVDHGSHFWRRRDRHVRLQQASPSLRGRGPQDQEDGARAEVYPGHRVRHSGGRAGGADRAEGGSRV